MSSWRGGSTPQDPFPATTPNERIEEHLLRVSVAVNAFRDPTRVAGYDDRGDLFVRYALPAHRRTLRFDDARLLFGLSRANVGISKSSFPDNEVWTYPGIHETMTFILVKRGNHYRQGRAADLLPSTLRTAISQQGRRQTELNGVALLAMQYIFGQLATSGMEYGNALGDVDGVLEKTASPFLNLQSSVLDIQRRVGLREVERETLRQERAPVSASRIRDDVTPVPYLAEVTRYRNPDGTTRLQLAWQVTPSDRFEEAGDILFLGSVVTDPRTASRQTTQALSQMLTSDQISGSEHVSPSIGEAACAPDRCDPVVQLDLFRRSSTGSIEKRLATSVWEVQAVDALRTDGLEMSDVIAVDPIRNEPILSTEVIPGTPISIYFEAYGFEGGANATRVKIDYEVVRRERGALLRRSRETPTSGELRAGHQGVDDGAVLDLEHGRLVGL